MGEEIGAFASNPHSAPAGRVRVDSLDAARSRKHARQRPRACGEIRGLPRIGEKDLLALAELPVFFRIIIRLVAKFFDGPGAVIAGLHQI